MPEFNKLIINGRLVRDAVYIDIPGGSPVAEFTLVSGKKYVTKAGRSVDDTLFIECKAFGKSAETICRYFGKGSVMLAWGRLRLERWCSGGKKRNQIRMIVDEFEMNNSKAPTFKERDAMEFDQPPPSGSCEVD